MTPHIHKFASSRFLGDVHTMPNTEKEGCKTLSDRASAHFGNTSSGIILAPEQDCSALLLKVERAVSGSF